MHKREEGRPAPSAWVELRWPAEGEARERLSAYGGAEEDVLVPHGWLRLLLS